MISWGDLPEPEEVAVSNPSPGVLEFTWPVITSGKDRALILAYVDESNKIGDLCGARRNEGKHVLDCQDLIGMEADLYMGFVAEERDRCSNSVYLGRMRIE